MSDVSDVPDGQAARLAVAFASVLRGAGLDVPVSRVVSFTDALGVVGLSERDRAYWAGRATLVRAHEDVGTYDVAFAAFFSASGGEIDVGSNETSVPITLALDSDEEEDDGGQDEAPRDPDELVVELRFSNVEVLRHKDFADYDDAELSECLDVMRRMRFAGAPRRSRRRRRARSGGQLDVARTVRAAFATAGEPIRLHARAPTQRPRRLVLLLDVSGSMDPYARALLRFVHAAVAGRQRVEAFTLGTRLTRLTRELSSRDPDVAMHAVSGQVADWSGGTRLGDVLRRFNDEWGQRGLAHGAHVVILSDGWDRGDPMVLGEEMARLHRVAYQVVWVNPLKVTPGYAPLARGMAAALPHIDRFVEGHSVDAMERLIDVISSAETRELVS